MNEESVKRPGQKQRIGLLDLNETIFHEIFQYLSFDEIDFSVRYTSKALSELVNHYFESQSLFILVSECNNSRYKYTKPAMNEQHFFKTISVLTRNKTIVGFKSLRKNDLPSPKFIDSQSMFFKAMSGKLIHGYLGFKEVLSSRILGKFARMRGYRLFAHLFEYNGYKKTWLPITHSFGLPSRICKMRNRGKILISSCCSVQDAIFLLIIVSTNIDSHLSMADYYLVWILFEIPSEKTEGDRKDVSNLSYSIKWLDLSSHAKELSASCHWEKMTWKLFELSSNEIILLGAVDAPISGYYPFSGSIRLWRGTLNKSGSSISWKVIEFSGPSKTSFVFRRKYEKENSTSLVFKLRDNIYLFENWLLPRQFQKVSYPNVNSVRFNIQEQKYYENDVSGLPWNIYRIISAITDKEETYALLLCLVDLGVSGSGLQYRALLMFFNDADGFDHKMNNSNFLKSLCKEGLAHSFDTLVRMK